VERRFAPVSEGTTTGLHPRHGSGTDAARSGDGSPATIKAPSSRPNWFLRCTFRLDARVLLRLCSHARDAAMHDLVHRVGPCREVTSRGRRVERHLVTPMCRARRDLMRPERQDIRKLPFSGGIDEQCATTDTRWPVKRTRAADGGAADFGGRFPQVDAAGIPSADRFTEKLLRCSVSGDRRVVSRPAYTTWRSLDASSCGRSHVSPSPGIASSTDASTGGRDDAAAVGSHPRSGPTTALGSPPDRFDREFRAGLAR
jgi:hypothetical protein